MNTEPWTKVSKVTNVAVRKVVTRLWDLTCHTGSHSVYLPPGRGDILAFTPYYSKAGTRLSDPGGMQGWVDLDSWFTRPKMVTHPSTNRARRGLTLFMRRTSLTITPRRQRKVRDYAYGIRVRYFAVHVGTRPAMAPTIMWSSHPNDTCPAVAWQVPTSNSVVYVLRELSTSNSWRNMNVKVLSQHVNWAELQFVANSAENSARVQN